MSDNKKVVSISVNYKNMEKVVLPTSEILDLTVEGVTQRTSGIGTSLESIRNEAEYVSLSVKRHVDEEASKRSNIYTGMTPYDRLLHDKTAVSFGIDYIDGSVEEIFFPYNSKNPEVVGDNDLLDMVEQVIEIPYQSETWGLVMSFGSKN